MSLVVPRGGDPGVHSQGPFISGHPVSVQAEQEFGPHCRTKSNLFSVHVGLQQGCPLSLLWTGFLGAVEGCRGFGVGTSEFCLFFLQMTWSCWPPLAKTLFRASPFEDPKLL
ncbi:hypothetical protein XENOCAPTIV_014171 [Xenoophorus captivus]|uniref:Uncharacterized protein n=1 Tax=Xenoophorus captivus TaxID=1517983 RepID=A0ABV0RU55_9TELE